jgi:hypothetical protein
VGCEIVGDLDLYIKLSWKLFTSYLNTDCYILNMLLSDLRAVALALIACHFHSISAYDPRAYKHALAPRQSGSSSNSTTVDLGYSVYQGFFNSTTGLNVWQG